MSVTVHLIDIRTMRRGTYEYPYDWFYIDEFNGEKRSSEFIWEDGNYSCDCNRLSFLYPDAEEEFVCNGDDRVVIIEKIVNNDDGTIVYEEVIETPPQETPNP